MWLVFIYKPYYKLNKQSNNRYCTFKCYIYIDMRFILLWAKKFINLNFVVLSTLLSLELEPIFVIRLILYIILVTSKLYQNNQNIFKAARNQYFFVIQWYLKCFYTHCNKMKIWFCAIQYLSHFKSLYHIYSQINHTESRSFA